MTAARDGGIVTLASQVEDHVARLQAVLAGGSPPSLPIVKQAIAATRAVRGSASMAGLDTFQAFLSRVFQLLEAVDSGVVPWSTRVEAILRDIALVESYAAGRLSRGEPAVDDGDLEGFDAVLTSLIGTRAQPAQAQAASLLPMPGPESAAPAPVVAMLPDEMETALLQIQRLRQSLESQALPVAARDVGLATLEREFAMLKDAIRTPHAPAAPTPETPQEGLRNHCEGALRNLVEAAAQEVLDEARERGLRLGMRVTGVLDPVDEGLGAALLELLAYLWSDSLDAQVNRADAEIDTVLRNAGDRLVIEVRDPEASDPTFGADDDVLGLYAGLRRSRPLVESLHGTVEVEPKGTPGCRFRLSLPLSLSRPHATVVRVGRHEIAIASSAIVGVHEATDVRAAFDGAGAFVEIGGLRVPILHLAFALNDIGYDELVREHIVVVGSFERRAAIFASQAHRSIEGRLTPEAQGLWAGTLETDSGVVPMLHVGALLGRCGPAEVVTASSPVGESASRGPARVLVVVSVGAEREVLTKVLSGAGHLVRGVATADEAWTALESGPVDLVICDLRLPEMNAQQLAERRRTEGRFQEVPVMLVLAHPGEQAHLVVQQLGASAWLRSPVQPAELVESVRGHVAARS